MIIKHDSKQLNRRSTRKALIYILLLCFNMFTDNSNVKGQCGSCTTGNCNLLGSSGTFPSTNCTPDFLSDYVIHSGSGTYNNCGCCGGFPDQGEFSIGTDASQTNSGNTTFWWGFSHTNDGTNLLMVNGWTAQNRYDRAWYKTVSVSPGTTYNFSAWVINLATLDSKYDAQGHIIHNDAKPKAFLVIRYGSNADNISSTETNYPGGLPEVSQSRSPSSPGTWIPLCGTWTAPGCVTSVELDIILPHQCNYQCSDCIPNSSCTTIDGSGNDLGIDDIVFNTVAGTSATFCSCSTIGPNMIGDAGSFSQSSCHNFVKQGTWKESACNIAPASGGTSYTECSNAHVLLNGSGFSVGGNWVGIDHTTGIDNGVSYFLFFDGPPAGNASSVIWARQYNVIPGAKYEFIAYVRSCCFNCTQNSISGVDVSMQYQDPQNLSNNLTDYFVHSNEIATPYSTKTGNTWTSVPFPPPQDAATSGWVKICGTWAAPANVTSATLQIWIKPNNMTGSGDSGNDGGIDDISFYRLTVDD
jgi:hypothetical protein